MLEIDDLGNEFNLLLINFIMDNVIISNKELFEKIRHLQYR